MIISFDVRYKKLAYCLMDNNLKIVDWNVINLESKSQLDMIDELNEKLDQLKGNITKVIIKKQSSLKFRRGIISNIIACYYMFHFIDVVFVNPKNKTNSLKLKHSQRNKYSTGLTLLNLTVFDTNNKWSNFFKSMKTKVYLTDCFLQLINFLKEIKSNNIVNGLQHDDSKQNIKY